ncbi:MFS transporter [Hydrogenophaga sp.]|uniref:MFS transporter n=1 Tax=Hydrogenophaga sp. TaxID=1904254 RepID=UPI002716CB29|nr:MFS transporter [Hydrogenophaga sp.]MDO9433941.1 MFS transporter [Hydrogenophaga sp.]
MTAEGDRSTWGRELAVIIVGHVCLHAALGGGRMAAPLLALQQGMGTGAAGLLMALFALTQVFVSIPMGRYADRHGLRRPMTLCVASAMLGAGLAAIWPVYPVLCVSALLIGGAVGSATITLQRHAGRMASSPAQVRKVFSWLAIAPAISGLVGPVITGFMIDHAGFRAAFATLAALPIVCWFMLRHATEIPNDAPPAGQRPPAWDLLREPRMRRLLIVNWFMSASWDLHGFMVPVLAHERGISASAIGMILGAFAAASILVRLLMTVLASRLREWATVAGALALAGTAFILYPFSPSAWMMGACSAAIGLSMGATQPMIMSMLHAITPRHRQGEALAVRMVTVNLSSVSMPLLWGALTVVVGVPALFWAMGVIVVGGSTMAAGLRGHVHEDASGK